MLLQRKQTVIKPALQRVTGFAIGVLAILAKFSFVIILVTIVTAGKIDRGRIPACVAFLTFHIHMFPHKPEIGYIMVETTHFLQVEEAAFLVAVDTSGPKSALVLIFMTGDAVALGGPKIVPEYFYRIAGIAVTVKTIGPAVSPFEAKQRRIVVEFSFSNKG